MDFNKIVWQYVSSGVLELPTLDRQALCGQLKHAATDAGTHCHTILLKTIIGLYGPVYRVLSCSPRRRKAALCERF